jgi:small subunit ribosomal protein S1
VKAQVLDVDVEKERISLGMKQLEGGGAGAAAGTGASRGVAAAGGVKKGDVLTVTVRAVQDAGLDVQVGDDGATGFVKRTDLGRDRDEQRAERFQVGQKFDALVIGFDRSKKPNFSIKAMQIAEEKQAVAQYGSSDSGASLGDILGAALKEKAEASSGDEKPAKKKSRERRRFFTGTPPKPGLRGNQFPDSLRLVWPLVRVGGVGANFYRLGDDDDPF